MDTLLTDAELALIQETLSRHPEVDGAVLFGSRAKGCASPSSDIDLALEGDLDELQAEAVAADLDDLPLPYRFDVKALACIDYAPLREHITRIGIRIR